MKRTQLSKLDMAVKDKSLSEAWKVLNSKIEDEDSNQARGNRKKRFKTLVMTGGESTRECVAIAKCLSNDVRYHTVEITNDEIYRRI